MEFFGWLFYLGGALISLTIIFVLIGIAFDTYIYMCDQFHEFKRKRR